MQQRKIRSLRNSLDCLPAASGGFIWSHDASIRLADLIRGSALGGRIRELEGRSVLIATLDQFATAVALIELDGVARRLVLCPPELSAEHLHHVIATAEVDAVVFAGDAQDLPATCAAVPLRVPCTPQVISDDAYLFGERQTEWIMLTSGTTGAPKMVAHSFMSLTGAINTGAISTETTVWSTFYDIRRYGGLQIFFRGVLGGSLVLSSSKESIREFLARAGARGITHISGTPSHWRQAIMSPSVRDISPKYIRLSGEISDQAILDNLRAVFPGALVAHAYASTEAGVAFEVKDGREGFPSSMIETGSGDVEMRVVDGALRIRSGRIARAYVNRDDPPLSDADGFIDTGDILELRGDRYHFIGRRGGIINVGGLKVHPEEVETVINRHPEVHASLVRARKNPITGAIVVADVVLRREIENVALHDRAARVKQAIMAACRQSLSEYKVPAEIRFVAQLDVATTGKLVRSFA